MDVQSRFSSPISAPVAAPATKQILPLFSVITSSNVFVFPSPDFRLTPPRPHAGRPPLTGPTLPAAARFFGFFLDGLALLPRDSIAATPAQEPRLNFRWRGIDLGCRRG
ncbi:hypothetical protein ZWY2020_023660 [Hordeum vulgare]|nr:hypothetical protein ZWY2020_023660 [Hordeum vulgare]